MSNTDFAALDRERLARRAKLKAALQDEEDPLACYEEFVKWTLDHYPPSHIPRSGLLELLEEAGRQFLDDQTYKGDRRYLKLWLTYAQHVEDDHEGASMEVCRFLLAHDIGTGYAQLYEDYALTLERLGRRQDVDKVYQYGIKRKARPVERLKKTYAEFQARSSNSESRPPPISRPVPLSAWENAPPEAKALRQRPLKNFGQPTNKPANAATSTSSAVDTAASKSMSKHGHNRYAPMLAPPAPNRRPEKLRLDLSLLFTKDGTEYSSQEARAKSMGLLGKKWAPPPPPSPHEYDSPVSSPEGNIRGVKRAASKMNKVTYSEPTVTLATKEALADVFGMYNSPEKTLRFGAPAGSKYAPVRKLDPITPMGSLTAISSFQEVNPRTGDKTIVLSRPSIDENASERKPKPVLPSSTKSSVGKATAPQHSENSAGVIRDRRLQSAKEQTVINDENEPMSTKNVSQAPISEDKERELKAFHLTSTPVSSNENRPSALARKDIYIDAPRQVAPAKFVPFVDSAAQPNSTSSPLSDISSRPPAIASRPLEEKPAFTPFVDAEPPRMVLGERSRAQTPLQAMSTPSTSTDEDCDQDMVGEVAQEYYDDFESTDQSSSDFDDGQAPADVHTPVYSDLGDEDEQAFDDDDDDDDDDMAGYQAPLGGRLGQFNVMTPITERTFEYTHTTATSASARATPSDGQSVRAFTLDQIEAKESADMLAAELANDSDEGEDGVGHVEERTGTMSLSDAIAAASSFKPPNPCNPFEGAIIASLLSFIPAESGFKDLRSHTSNQLDTLQKFSKKKGRRSSGNSSRGSAQDSVLRVNLNGRQYDVLDKLGEGGFGAVFEAIDLAAAAAKGGRSCRDDLDEDGSEDEDEDDIPKVALKVVKPRNLWEFHVLRRIHLTVPPRLRRSIITPEDLYVYSDESFLVLELCKQGTLLDVVNGAPQAGITQQGACLDELLVIFFTIELLRLLEGLHRAGFIHGDVKIDNCLLRLEDVPGPASAWSGVYQPSGESGWGYKGIKMIDFGRTIDTRLFPAGQRFTGDWDPDARDCLEMREGKPWTYQTDYFGLAGIIFCMLYGKYIEASSITPVGGPPPDGAADDAVRYRLATPFKRYWQGDLWTRLFDVLLNSALVRPRGQLPLCEELGQLREEMEKWLQANCNRASNSLKGLLKKVDLMTLGGKDGR